MLRKQKYIKFMSFGKVISIMIVFTIIALIMGNIIFQKGMSKFEYYVNNQRKASLKEKVSIAQHALIPLLESISKEKIPKEEGLTKAREIISTIIFDDEFGRNYFFMVKLDGTAIALPYRKYDEMKNLINLKDSKGNFIIRKLVNNVKEHPEGSYTEYLFPNPMTQLEENKLSYAVYLKELDVFIGTGAYMSRSAKKQIGFITDWFLWSFGATFVILLPIALVLLFLRNRNKLLKKEILENEKLTKNLEKNEENLRITLNSIGDAVIAVTPDGFVSMMNPVAEQLTGWKLDEAVGKKLKSVFKIINSKTGTETDNPVNKVIQSGQIVGLKNNTVLLSKDGNSFQISDSAAPIINSYGIITGVVLVFRDVSEEYKLKEEAKQKELVFRTVFETSPYSIVINDAETGEYILVNSAFEKTTGYLQEEVIGKNIKELNLNFDLDRSKEIQNQIEIKGRIDNETTSGKRKNGKIYYSMYSSRVIEYNGKSSILTISMDITEVKKLQEELNHAQKMDAVGKLAGGIAHDFNNMLAGIMGSAEILKIHTDLPDNQKKFIDIIIESTKRASDLTKKILTFARKERIELIDLNIHEVLDSGLEIIRRTIDKRIRIETLFEADKIAVNGDKSQLMNAFLNLCINAAQSMTNGGKLTISSRNVYLDERFCKASQFNIKEGEYVLIEFQDTGVGISQENISKIFDPFFTTKELGEGTGLGLSTVYGTVLEHNGAVSVYSEIGNGSVFHVYLPSTLHKINSNHLNNDLIKGKGTILVVDDEDIIRVTASAILKHLGYTVITAQNGQEGVEKYLLNKDKIDLIILDMIMPVMNGRDCFVKIKEINPSANIIVASGFSRESELDELRSLGLKSFLRKPYHTAEMSKIVAENI